MISGGVVEKYFQRIWSAEPLLKELYSRCIDDATIRKYRLGEHQGRITIPIKNQSGYYVNIRSYLPGAPGAEKFKNLKGRAKTPRLYPLDQLSYNKIVVCGGEIKALATSIALNEKGYGAVTALSGEGNWHQSLTAMLQGKDLWIMMDVDEAGKLAAENVARFCYPLAASVRIVTLPLDREKLPKGDVNDFLKEYGKEALIDVVEQCANNEWSPRARRAERTEPKEVSLTQSTHAQYSGQRLKVKATISTLDLSPYVIPRTLTVNCSREERCCGLCPVYVEQPSKEYEIDDESPSILEMVNARKQAQRLAIMEELEIPPVCGSCQFEVLNYFNVEDARVSPQLEITERSNEKALQPAICIGDGLELNETYELVGRMHPHPQTQQSTLLISTYKAAQDALSQYKIDEVTEAQLEKFQPRQWSLDALEEKLAEIYTDFENNVTNVWQRRVLHEYIDLAYHSPLFIEFDKKLIKGWVEVLVVGDSSQGKSETVQSLLNHYGLGEKIECKNATVAGLLGGLQQLGTRWFVTWGLFPTHDRRLVILEELKGAPVEVISKLTDMRSSGVAEIPKIEKRRTHARTRMIALSNPRSNLSLDRYNFGVQAIQELIGSPEDLRRFDACLVVEKSEVDPGVINDLQLNRPTTPHVFDSQLCRSLILWAWTVEKAVFTDAATTLILKKSIEFCEKFSESAPIVDRGSMRYKLARLSAALAARTFSAQDLKTVRVRECHVEYICQMLDRVYTAPAFAYDSFSKAEKLTSSLVDEHVIAKRINDTPYPKDLVEHLLYKSHIELQDIQDWCAWDRQESQAFLSLLVRKHALTRFKGSYRKTAPFITLLKTMDVVERPDFIEEEF